MIKKVIFWTVASSENEHSCTATTKAQTYPDATCETTEWESQATSSRGWARAASHHSHMCGLFDTYVQVQSLWTCLQSINHICLSCKVSAGPHFPAAWWNDMLRIQPCVEQHSHFLSSEGSLRKPRGCDRSLRQTLTAISSAQIPLITAGMNPWMGCEFGRPVCRMWREDSRKDTKELIRRPNKSLGRLAWSVVDIVF